jgi:hypothetical protein
VQPFFALLTLRAVSVLVAPGPEDGCPSASRVSAALVARAPASQRLRGTDSEGDLTLILPAPGSPQEPSFSLVDQQGRLRLFRTLARPGSVHARDCLALADTVALIVQRYLEEVELPEIEAAAKRPAIRPALPPPRLSPPAPAPADVLSPSGPRWDFSFGWTGRFASDIAGLGVHELRLSIGRTLGRRLDTGFLTAGWLGVSGWTPHTWRGGQGQVIRVPFGLAFMWRRMLSTVELQLGLAGLGDAWILSAMYQKTGSFEYHFSYAGAATGGLQVPIGKRLFFRAFADFAVSVRRPQYFDSTSKTKPVFSTPLVFGDAGFALGMSLR